MWRTYGNIAGLQEVQAALLEIRVSQLHELGDGGHVEAIGNKRLSDVCSKLSVYEHS